MAPPRTHSRDPLAAAAHTPATADADHLVRRADEVPPPPERDRRRKRKRRKTKTHRAHGLPNANQVFLTLVATGMLFLQLLRSHWLVFESSHATAGLSSFSIQSPLNDSNSRVSWGDFCNENEYNFTLPLASTQLRQPFSTREEAQRACATSTPETLRLLTSTSIALSLLSLTIALYFHVGAPSQRQIVLLGMVPGGALLLTGVLGTVGLAVWQKNFGPYDNGDCFSVAVASTVIAYVVSISMAIRWRWPGIFAVDNEQQAFEVRRNWRSRRPPPPPPVDADDDTRDVPSPSPHSTNNFHALV